MFLLLIYCILIYYFSVPHPSNISHFPTLRKTPAAGIAIALFQASCAAVSTAGPARCRPTRPPPPRCRRRPAASTTRSTSSSNRGGSSGVGGRPADRRPGDQLPVGLHSLTHSLTLLYFTSCGIFPQESLITGRSYWVTLYLCCHVMTGVGGCGENGIVVVSNFPSLCLILNEECWALFSCCNCQN